MSCNYAEGLSPYENKGILGLPESFDSQEDLERKCTILAKFIENSKHVVVHTGAGISTSAGIPDFRGPNGVWTLEKKGLKPTINMSFSEAKPTKTHMALKKLVEMRKVHYIISQNIDGLHLKSGLGRDHLAELHGNMFVDECNVCGRRFVRSSPSETVGKRTLGVGCLANRVSGRPCRGKLHDDVLDWEHSLPEKDLLLAELHSSIADLSICLGTTLQIVPSGNLPLETLKYDGKMVVCNLQPTKHDNKADLKINYYVDSVLDLLMKYFHVDIPAYDPTNDPTKIVKEDIIIEWNISRTCTVETEVKYKAKCQGVKKKRVLVKKRQENNIKLIKVDNLSKACNLSDGLVFKVKNEESGKEFKFNESKYVKNRKCDTKFMKDEKCETKLMSSETIAMEIKVKDETCEAIDDKVIIIIDD